MIALGGPRGKSGQRTIAFGKLQPAQARRVERGRGVGCRRMPSQRQNRAVGQVLLDLGRKRAVELTQHDADARIGVARAQRRVKIELVVARQRQDRDGVLDPRRRQPAASLRPAGDEHRAGRLDQGGEFGVGRPQHHHPMAAQPNDLARGAERQRVAADNNHRGDRRGDRRGLDGCIHRRRTQPFAQSSPSPAGGG